MKSFEETFNALNKINLKSHTTVFGYPKTEEKYFIAGQESRQTEVDELQKRVDGAYIKLAMLRQTELWREDDIFELFDELEQAIKGGADD